MGRAGDRPHWQRTFLSCPRLWLYPSDPDDSGDDDDGDEDNSDDR